MIPAEREALKAAVEKERNNEPFERALGRALRNAGFDFDAYILIIGEVRALAKREKALQEECYDAGYYYIGLCQWNLGGIENFEAAYVSFAKAELLKGPLGAQANKRFVDLYREAHNGNTTGIDRWYKKAKAELNCGGKR